MQLYRHQDIAVRLRGFTLIELSIVLVIIGLIAGGVLVGKDLIKAAEIRKTISQRDQFDAATNTFRLKYNCLPGDCANAASIGVGASGTGVYGENGDGNGLISYVPSPTIYEFLNFWYHLSSARLINWEPTGNTAAGYSNTYFYDGDVSLTPFPAISSTSEGGLGATWQLIGNDAAQVSLPYNLAGNYYWIAGRIGGANDESAVLIPADAFAIDSKIDDGFPLAGNIRAAGDANQDPYGPKEVTPATGGSGNDTCVDDRSTPNAYNIANSNRTSANLCGLLIRASF